MEAPQHAHRFRHCLGRKKSATEDAFTQASDFAVFVDFFQPPSLQARNFQTNGIRSDVDSGEGGHKSDDQYSHNRGGSRKLSNFADPLRAPLLLRSMTPAGAVGSEMRGEAMKWRLQARTGD